MSDEASRPQAIPDEQLADVGVVFVHGIGDQKRAVTLRTFAEPLVAWVDARVKARGGTGADVTDGSMDQEGTDPAHEWVEIDLPGDAPARWLLAESLWAKSFPEPEIGAVLGWARSFSYRAARRVLGHLVRPVAATFDRTSHGMGVARESAEEMAGKGATTASGGVAAFQIVVYLVVGVLVLFSLVWVALLAYALALLAFAVVAVIGAFVVATLLAVGVKLPLVGGPARKVAAKLVTSVGDAYALVSERGSAASMRRAIHDHLTWVAARSRAVVVVGHSQGAALSVYVLSRRNTPRVDWLVTLGGAVGLLTAGEPDPVAKLHRVRPEMAWTNIWAGWDPVSAGPVVDSGASAGDRWDELYRPDPQAAQPVAIPVDADPFFAPDDQTEDSSAMPPVARAVGAGIGAIYGSMAEVALKAIPKPPEETEPPKLVPGPAEVAVHNRASLLFDHTTYADNWDQVIARIADIAARVSGHGDALKLEDEAVERRHVTAVRLLGATRLLNVVLAAIVAGVLVEGGLTSSLFRLIEDGVRVANETAADWVAGLPGAGVGDVIRYLLLVLLIFLIWHGLTAAAWSAWRRAERPRGAGAAVGPQRLRAGIFGVFVAITVAAPLVLVSWSLQREEPGALEDVGEGLLVFAAALLGTVGWSWLGLRPRPLPQRRPDAGTSEAVERVEV